MKLIKMNINQNITKLLPIKEKRKKGSCAPWAIESKSIVLPANLSSILSLYMNTNHPPPHLPKTIFKSQVQEGEVCTF